MVGITKLVDRVKVQATSSGTGPFVLGPTVLSYRGTEALSDGMTYSYVVESGNDFECGTGYYVAASSQLVRTPIESSNGNAAVPFPPGVQVSFTALAQDIQSTGANLPIADALGEDPTVAISQRAATDAIASATSGLPINPYSPIDAAYADVMRGWQRNWITSDGHLAPAYPIGGVTGGLKNTTAGAAPEPWIWAQGINVLHEAWVIANRIGDASAAAYYSGVTATEGAFFMTKYSETDISSTTYGGSTVANTNRMTGLSDDSAWVANAFIDIVDMDGDPLYLTRAANLIAATLQIYRVSDDANNPVVQPTGTGAGASAPSGVAVKWNKLGILYDQSQGTTFGKVSSIFEVDLARAAYRLCLDQSGTLPAGLREAFRQYAHAILSWASGYMLTPAPTNNTRSIQYLAATNFNLDPNVANANSKKQPYNPQQVYLQPEDAYKPADVRGNARDYDAGTCMVGALALLVNANEPDADLLNLAKNIATAIPKARGFGRTLDGVPYLQCVREPWTGGSRYPLFTRLLLVSVSVPDVLPLFQALYNTARYINATQGNGFCGPDWFPEEYSSNDQTLTWNDENAIGYGSTRGGGMGRREQLMTHSSCVAVVQAARLLEPYENALLSGIAQQCSLEQVPAELTALKAATQRTANPIVKLSNNTFLLWNKAVGVLSFFLNNVEQVYFSSTGYVINSSATIHGAHVVDQRIYFGFLAGQFGYLDVNGNGDWYIALGNGLTITGNHAKNRLDLGVGAQVVASVDGAGNIRAAGSVTQNVGIGNV
jgi:hypothetical protein